MDILEKIVLHKHKEVADRKVKHTIKSLEQSAYFEAPVASLSQYLVRMDKSGIIAEFKRHSPSKGDININAQVAEVTKGYVAAGASALSVLTDNNFFKGKEVDLMEAREFNDCPILRKDFVIDEYQIIEAKSIGASAILLIGECLEKKRLRELAKTARSLGLEVLMEVHSAEQLDKLCPEVNVVGVNNRNLKTFEVSIQTSMELYDVIPDEFIKISESGISDPQSIVQLKEQGFQGFLIGETFMKTDNPAQTCADFIRKIEFLEDLYQNAIA